MAALGERARPDDAVIGSVFAWILGLGVLFLSIFVSGSSGSDGTAAVRVLFGSILGLSAAEARLAAAIAMLAALALALIARPLLFGSVDLELRVPSACRFGALGIFFFVILAVVAAEATQAVGALLLLGLLAAPGGAARLLTDRPWRGLALSAAIAVLAMWLGLLAQLPVRLLTDQHSGDCIRRRRLRPRSPAGASARSEGRQVGAGGSQADAERPLGSRW